MAFCIYSLVGFFVLPALIKWQLLKLLPGIAERRVAVRHTRIHQIAFEGVDASLAERRGSVGLFRGRGGSVVVRRGQDGTISLLTLLAGVCDERALDVARQE